jgi:putative transposase
MISFKRMRFPKEVILQCVYWYSKYSLSYRDLEEMMGERGVDVDHSTVNDWVVKFVPLLETEFNKKRKAVGTSWRVDETYVKINGEWKYLYRAVDKNGDTVDFLLTAKRDTKAAKRFFKKAIKRNGAPIKINIDKSGANKAGAEAYNIENGTDIEIRQCKYLNNVVEQDHRFIKKIIRPMLGFKNFFKAKIVLAGIEVVRMIKKGQMNYANSQASCAQKFYSLADQN